MKSFIPASKWLLRIALVIYLFTMFFERTLTLQFHSVQYLIGLCFILSSVLLLVGGFMHRPILTIFAGMCIVILSALEISTLYTGRVEQSMVTFFLPAAVGFYFFARGNQD